MGLALDPSTTLCYTSALNSYLTFCKTHSFPPDPTADTLSFYVAYMSAFISPASVDSYLSGICSQLEPYYPHVRTNRASLLVVRTLKGARRRHARVTTRKSALSWDDVSLVSSTFATSTNHDDRLFVAIFNTAFFALLRLGETTMPDNPQLRDPSKLTLRSSFNVLENGYCLWLPRFKGDNLFEGNRIVVLQRTGRPDPLASMTRYLASRDTRFPLHPWLWLRESGTVPTRSWFVTRLRQLFPRSIAGHSLRAGGATALAEEGLAPDLIRAAGRWSSDAFERYIRKNPLLLHALILENRANARVAPARSPSSHTL